MSICVPSVAKDICLADFLAGTLTMKLYRNNETPNVASIAEDFTEITGGGYTDFDMTFANWEISPNSPSRALYTSRYVLQFTGPTDTPGTIYGYYVIDSNGVLRWAERFPAASVPFVPINGSVIKIRPRFSAGSIFND